MAIKHGTTTITELKATGSGRILSNGVQIHAYHNNTWVFDERCIRFYSSSSFTVKLANSNGSASWNGTIQYKGSLGWTSYTANNTVTAIQVSYGNGLSRYEVSFRGISNTRLATANSTANASTFTITGTDVYCEGDLLYLLDYTASTSYSAAQYTYARLFYGCTALKSAPKMSLATLPGYCYAYTYYNCSNLAGSPTLSYTGFASSSTYHCYYMFYNCKITSVTMPILTTFPNYCYYYMFSNCKYLTKSPAILPNNSAVIIGASSFRYMFYQCTSITNAVFTSATTFTTQAILGSGTTISGTYALAQMFSGCISLNYATKSGSSILYNIVKLSPTALSSNCYRQMYAGCTNMKFATSTTAGTGGRWSHAYRIPTSGSATGTTTNATYQFAYTNASSLTTLTPTLGTTYYGFIPN